MYFSRSLLALMVFVACVTLSSAANAEVKSSEADLPNEDPMTLKNLASWINVPQIECNNVTVCSKIDNLNRITHLNLNNMGLKTPNVPFVFANLNYLTSVDLSSNMIDGQTEWTVVFLNNTRLASLNLDNNVISDLDYLFLAIPSNCTVKARDNRIAQLPRDMVNFTGSVYLANNFIAGPLPNIAGYADCPGHTYEFWCPLPVILLTRCGAKTSCDTFCPTAVCKDGPCHYAGICRNERCLDDMKQNGVPCVSLNGEGICTDGDCLVTPPPLPPVPSSSGAVTAAVVFAVLFAVVIIVGSLVYFKWYRKRGAYMTFQ